MNPVLGFENQSHTNNHLRVGIGGEDKTSCAFVFFGFSEYPDRRSEAHAAEWGTVLIRGSCCQRVLPQHGEAMRQAPAKQAEAVTAKLYKALGVWLSSAAPTYRPTEMSDIKTSLKPSAPVLSKRYTKSPRYVYVSHHIHRTILPVASVDIQHLSIPAALFTDAVDPEWVSSHRAAELC